MSLFFHTLPLTFKNVTDALVEHQLYNNTLGPASRQDHWTILRTELVLKMYDEIVRRRVAAKLIDYFFTGVFIILTARLGFVLGKCLYDGVKQGIAEVQRERGAAEVAGERDEGLKGEVRL